MDDLLDVLLHENYFSYPENALKYVAAIRDFIYTIPNRKPLLTNDNSEGVFYCEYKANKHTSWYIIFDIHGERHLIRNIINNHTADYPAFISNALK